MDKQGKKTARRKGEEGYWTRDTQAAHAAAAEANAIFPDAESFTAAADRYFDECDSRDELYGEAGLCLALSKYNPKGRPVTLKTLRRWYDGDDRKDLQEAVQLAYLRIQKQIETDPRYREKAVVSRSIFLQKQARLGGYQDKTETKNDMNIRVSFGAGMDKSDFE